MIDVTCDLNSSSLLFKASGNNFQDLIEILKLNKCRYNPTFKAFVAPITSFSTLESELSYALKTDFDNEGLEISELTRRQVREYLSNLKELKLADSRRIVNWDLLKFPPLKGKAPNERYQSQDLSRALNQNRFLFNWEMGLGKSYSLAALIENLRYYKLINKCLIFSTGVGVFNLKDELLKFGTTLEAEKIFVIDSLSDNAYETRDIFNTEKYDYDIIIMTYDTFKGINDYYYDMANRPKTQIKKVENAEEELKQLTKEKRTAFRATYNGEKNDFDKSFRNFCKKDSQISKLKKNLSALKDGLYPSRKVNYQKSFTPIKEWGDGQNIGLFLDESHSISNPKSQRAKHIKMNLPNFEYRYEFTGTFADKYEKMYMQLFVLDRELVLDKDYNTWLYEYCDMGTNFSQYAINPNGWKIDKITELNAQLLRHYAAKREMLECLDLPLNYDVPTINISMTDKHRHLYESFVKEELRLSKERKQAGNESNKDVVLNMFQIFQMAVDNPEIIKSSPSFEKFQPTLQKEIEDFDYINDSSKIKALNEIIQERVDENNERGIIWYYHPDTKDKIVEYLSKYDPVVIDAGLTNEELNSKIKEFKSNENHKLLIGSINIMNTSVTVTECAFSVYLERTYNYTVYSQSKGRIFRPGQTKVTRNYTLSYKDTIDNLQLENLKHKGDIINSLLNKQFISQDIWKKIFNFNLGDDV